MVEHKAVPKVAQNNPPYRPPRSTPTRLRRPRPQGHHQQATQNPLPTNPSKGIVEQEARNNGRRQPPAAPLTRLAHDERLPLQANQPNPAPKPENPVPDKERREKEEAEDKEDQEQPSDTPHTQRKRGTPNETTITRV